MADRIRALCQGSSFLLQSISLQIDPFLNNRAIIPASFESCRTPIAPQILHVLRILLIHAKSHTVAIPIGVQALHYSIL